jgi:hypothetical protein
MVVPPDGRPAPEIESVPPTVALKVPVRMPSIEIEVFGSDAATATTDPWSSRTSLRLVDWERVIPVTIKPLTSGVPKVAELTAEER